VTNLLCVVTFWILEPLPVLLSYVSTYLSTKYQSSRLSRCSMQALTKDSDGDDYLAIAWEYPGQTLEVVPVTYSRTTRPGWPVTCSVDSDCDDGFFCNGMLFHHWLCFHLVRTPHQHSCLVCANVVIWIQTFHKFIR